MEKFSDTVTEQIYLLGFADGIPKHIGKKAKWILSLLNAAFDWQDIGIIGQVTTFQGSPERYGIQIEGKWYVTFAWNKLIGPIELKLERR